MVEVESDSVRLRMTGAARYCVAESSFVVARHGWAEPVKLKSQNEDLVKLGRPGRDLTCLWCVPRREPVAAQLRLDSQVAAEV